MSTPLNPKKILRELASKPSVLSGLLSSALGNVSKSVLSELVLAYYNGAEVKARKQDGTPTAVTQELGIDHLLFSGSERLAFLVLAVTERFRLDQDTRDPTDDQIRIIQKVVKELQNSHNKFRAAVKWLCSSKDTKPAVSPQKLINLLESGKLEWGRYPSIDRASEDFVTYFEEHGLRHLTLSVALQDGKLLLILRRLHFVDLFCAFLLNECAVKDPSKMPVKVCRRCDKLFLSKRTEAGFCSDDCRRDNFWSPEKHRDYTYVCRLETFAKKCFGDGYGYSQADLREKLESPKVKTRLREIETNWHDWSKIKEKIKTIRAR